MTLVFVVALLVLIVTVLFIWKLVFIARIKSVEGGYKHDVILPHTEPVELYFADVSACSMKVRFCLSAAGVQYKENVIKLPSAGSWETKLPKFLKINPAGTVPVLVHKGHPIYESGEQIKYIANNLMPPNSIPLCPKDVTKTRENNYWVDKTSWHASEIFANLDEGLKRRVGNCIPMISIPSFPAIISTLSWKNVFEGILIGGVNDKQVFSITFSVLGVHAFKYLPMLRTIVKKGKAALFQHLLELEEFLSSKGTTYIGGENVSLGDIGWGAIFARMEYADWWVHVQPEIYPCVLNYWSNMRKLPTFIEATRHVVVDKEHSLQVTRKVKEWKKQFDWYRCMYE